MNIKILSIITILILFSCSHSKKQLNQINSEYTVDITNLDSVRVYLDGYWLIQSNKIFSRKHFFLFLDFDEEDYSSVWETIEYERGLFGNTVWRSSCEPFADLIINNDSVQIQLISLWGSDTLKMEYLSETKLIINGVNYLKHSGYKAFTE